ncbi:MAG TPA: acyl-CoA dehydrogenase domain-containing protein, partial [Gammaproteobacteria bacterium]|nr:acyl-CoA dehydrogenase domain-containing protein [Gammaproteobacteria bacterium]
LKHYEDEGAPSEDLPLVEWSCRMLLYKTQEQLHSFLRNFPNRWIAALLRLAIFPRGRTYSAPSDELGQSIAELVINPTAVRERLADYAYRTQEPTNANGLLQQALEMAERIKPTERKVFDARRAGTIEADDTPGQIDEAERKGVITPEEAASIREFDATVLALTGVDDFAPEELARTRREDDHARRGALAAAGVEELDAVAPD